MDPFYQFILTGLAAGASLLGLFGFVLFMENRHSREMAARKSAAPPSA